MPESWKTWGVPVVIGGDNLPSPDGKGLADMPNIAPPPGSGLTEVHIIRSEYNVGLWLNFSNFYICTGKK